jgi:hypothetical protein
VSTNLGDLPLLIDCMRQGLHKMACRLVRPFPYGLWTCRDGREVLFDRNYKPIWQLHDGIVEVADRREWVEHVHEEIFFDDQLPPHRQYAGMKRLRAIVVRWQWVGRRTLRRYTLEETD